MVIDMIKQRLIDLDMKITELAGYLDVSRPTFYKYIECFDKHELRSIPLSIRKLFTYIEGNPLIDKLNVIDYIIKSTRKKEDTKGQKLTKAKVVSLLKEYCRSNPDDTKLLFIHKILTENKFDFIINYLIKVDCASEKGVTDIQDQKTLSSFESVCKLVKENTEEK